MNKLFLAAQVAFMLVVIVLAVIGMGLFGWVWAIRVLAGKNKVGPRSTWDDQKARNDFGARRLEIKMALGVLVLYLDIVIFVVLINVPRSIAIGPVMWIELGVGVAVIMSMLVFGMLVGLNWRSDWDHVSKKLEKRHFQPVLL